MFKVKDLVTGEFVPIDRIEFEDGEISSVTIQKEGFLEIRENGEDLEIYADGGEIITKRANQA